ncbi:hypothetical protein MUK42_01745 [Musa troglodytarum]|uniref:Plastid division protein PDV1 n=1 Tax=Musa troglodytarum TaxID=320322 RepID=A0A9E7L9K9_9LILI|nr:hypothetical protein MUK42_01745 [Musa troglodytarum]
MGRPTLVFRRSALARKGLPHDPIKEGYRKPRRGTRRSHVLDLGPTHATHQSPAILCYKDTFPGLKREGMSVLSKRTHRIMVHASGESTICHEKDGLDHVGHVLMEIEEVEAVLERIWDLHDKISDAIHAISRAHFLRSVKGLRGGRQPRWRRLRRRKAAGRRISGWEDGAAMAEARSLNDIRSALENLEDQLEFFHTVQSQQRAERDAAIARLEQSRIILAMRLAEHRGKKYKVIEEALAFVGDVHNMGRFVTPETLYENEMTRSQSGKNLEDHECKGPSMLMQMFISSFAVAKRSLGLVSVQGILGNAAMFTVSMLALVHLNQVAFKGEAAPARDQAFYRRRNGVRFSRMDDSSHGGQLKRLDVLSARG